MRLAVRACRRLVIFALMSSVIAWAAAPAIASPLPSPSLATWGASGAVRAQVIVGTTLYVGGSFTSMISPDGTTTETRQHLAAIDLTTGDLLPWNPSANGSVLAMVADGSTLYIGGSFGMVNGKSRMHLAALDATGALLPWNPKANATVDALHLVGTTMYIAGAFTTLGGVARGYLGAASTDGSVLGWDPEANARVKAITSVASGTIVVGGAFDAVGGQSIDHIDGLDPVTGASTSWSYPSSQTVVGLITGPDDNVYGAVTGAGGKVRSWTSTGALRWTVSTDGDVNTVAYHGGQVIAGGHWVYMSDGAIKLPRLASFDPDTGAPDASWKPRPDKQVWSLATDGGATLSVGGVFTHMSASTYRRLAVFEG